MFVWQTHSDEKPCSDDSFGTMQFIYCTVHSQHKYLRIFYVYFKTLSVHQVTALINCMYLTAAYENILDIVYTK